MQAMARTIENSDVDFLVWNAGIFGDSGAGLDDGLPADMWGRQLGTGVKGVFYWLQARLADIENMGGKIA